MKKFISLLLVTIFCFSLCACGTSTYKNYIDSEKESNEKCQDNISDTDYENLSYKNYIDNKRENNEKYWDNISDTNYKDLSYIYVNSDIENTTDKPTSDTVGIAIIGIKESIIDESIVKIPSNIDGYDVIQILSLSVYTNDNQSTLELHNIKELYIPDSVNSIQMTGYFNKIENLRLPNNASITTYSKLYCLYNLKTLVLPNIDEKSNTTEISFTISNNTNNHFQALEDIYFGEGTTKIISDQIMFKKCDTLTLVAIPESVEFIGSQEDVKNGRTTTLENVEENIFPDTVTIVCKKDSYAETYAKKYNLNYELI